MSASVSNVTEFGVQHRTAGSSRKEVQMRILFATTAGAGHLGPLIPFAKAATAADVEIMVAAPASFPYVTMGDEAAWFRLQGSLGGVTAPRPCM